LFFCSFSLAVLLKSLYKYSQSREQHPANMIVPRGAESNIMSDYTNAAEELTADLQYLENHHQSTIKAARIELYGVTHVLYSDHTPAELEAFLKGLDRTYDSGYGSQELFGHVWLSDGSWLERHEYDGAESWSHKRLPKMPTRPAAASLISFV
jgi:hypothetical protein